MEHDLITGRSAAISTLSRCELGPSRSGYTHWHSWNRVCRSHSHSHTHTDVGRASAGAVVKGARLLQPRTPKHTPSPSTVHAGSTGGREGGGGWGGGQNGPRHRRSCATLIGVVTFVESIVSVRGHRCHSLCFCVSQRGASGEKAGAL